MEHQLWRLVWALPLVLAVGVLVIVWLKRLGLGTSAMPSTTEPPRVLSTTRLSDHTQVMVVEFGCARLIVVESSVHISVHEANSNECQPTGLRPSMHTNNYAPLMRHVWRKTP
jgi:flagellar biogenesis protein FliO